MTMPETGSWYLLKCLKCGLSVNEEDAAIIPDEGAFHVGCQGELIYEQIKQGEK